MKLLIKLELKKFNLKKYVLAGALITLGMCLFTTISLFAIEQEHATNYTDAIKMMNAAIIDCFLIYGGMLTVKMIVDEYAKRTVITLFTYSVKRTYLMFAKMFVIIGLTVCAALFTEIVCIAYLYLFGFFADLSLIAFSVNDFRYWIVQVIWGMIFLCTFTILQASVAIIKKSGQFVYISSLLSVMLVQMMISQEAERYVFPAGGLCVCLLIAAMKKYMNQLE